MLVAHYIGDHAQDALNVRLGCALTKLVQKGPYKNVTHCEAILKNWGGGVADIASSSLRDNGVRIKERVILKPTNWIIANVELWDAEEARAWFVQHKGEPYDSRGAWATVMPGHHRDGAHFCNESVGESVGSFLTPYCYTPSEFAAITLSFGKLWTKEFFAQAIMPA